MGKGKNIPIYGVSFARSRRQESELGRLAPCRVPGRRARPAAPARSRRQARLSLIGQVHAGMNSSPARRAHRPAAAIRLTQTPVADICLATAGDRSSLTFKYRPICFAAFSGVSDLESNRLAVAFRKAGSCREIPCHQQSADPLERQIC